jgi:hypothetical protein
VQTSRALRPAPRAGRGRPRARPVCMCGQVSWLAEGFVMQIKRYDADYCIGGESVPVADQTCSRHPKRTIALVWVTGTASCGHRDRWPLKVVLGSTAVPAWVCPVDMQSRGVLCRGRGRALFDDEPWIFRGTMNVGSAAREAAARAREQRRSDAEAASGRTADPDCAVVKVLESARETRRSVWDWLARIPSVFSWGRPMMSWQSSLRVDSRAEALLI